MAEIKKDLLTLDVHPGHYNSEAVIQWCSDSRFKKAYDKLLLDRGFEYPDAIITPGGANDLIHENEEIQKHELEKIMALIGLHNAPLVILMMHEDCGKLIHLHAQSGLSWDAFLHQRLQKVHEVVEGYCNSHPNAEVCKKYWASKGKPIEKITVELVHAHMKGLRDVSPVVMEAVNA